MRQNIAQLRFYEELNEFLPAEKRKRWFEHRFPGNPTVKDMVESLGVPHGVIDLILVNGESVNFSYRIQDGNRISVYPVFESLDISPLNRLRAQPLRDPKFILAPGLATLAKYLRLLGFDTLYGHDYSFSSICERARRDKRIILTGKKPRTLKKQIISHEYLIRSIDPKKQTSEVVVKFDLFSRIRPFTICLKCNSKIVVIEKNKIVDRLPAMVREHFKEFSICPHCERVYWRGLHYQTMLDFINQIEKSEKNFLLAWKKIAT